jgi:UDP-N-acetylmuramate dehydrogenase
MNWRQSLKGKVILGEPLKRHTTFKIGGKADLFIEPYDIDDLKILLKKIKNYKMPFFLLGAGSNILVSDRGVRAAVIHLNSPYFKKLILQKNFLEIGSAVMLKQVIIAAEKFGLSGIEFLAGIPATVGGALMMNAGIPQNYMGDLVEEVRVMDYNGKIKKLNKKNLKFSYRFSNLSGYIILSTRLKLIKKDRREIKKTINKYLEFRRLSQDLSWPSAGCVFKNPEGDSAGKLIDLCGLKGKRIGGACVSLKHANFIVNIKDARAKDVCRLMELVEKKVKDKFKINLKPEIIIWQ